MCVKFACVCVVVGVALGGCWCCWVPCRPPLQADSVRAAIVAAMDEFKVKDANGVVKMIGKRKKDFKGLGQVLADREGFAGEPFGRFGCGSGSGAALEQVSFEGSGGGRDRLHC